MDTAVSISVMDKAICRVSRAGARECHVPQVAPAVPTTILPWSFCLVVTSMRLPSNTLRSFDYIKQLSLRRLLCTQSTSYRPQLCFRMPPKQQATLGYVRTLQISMGCAILLRYCMIFSLFPCD